jgi:hypothetical protein
LGEPQDRVPGTVVRMAEGGVTSGAGQAAWSARGIDSSCSFRSQKLRMNLPVRSFAPSRMSLFFVIHGIEDGPASSTIHGIEDEPASSTIHGIEDEPAFLCSRGISKEPDCVHSRRRIGGFQALPSPRTAGRREG